MVEDPQARYFGALLRGSELLPGEGAQLGETPFDAWLDVDVVSGPKP